jgi:hypothetical protein
VLDDIGRKYAVFPELQARDLGIFRVDDTGRGTAVVSIPTVLIDGHG